MKPRASIRDPRRMRLRIFEPLADRSPLRLTRGDRARGIALQRLLALHVGGKRRLEPFKLRQPASNRVAPCARGRQLVRQLMGLVAKLAERGPLRVELCRGALVRGLRLHDRLMDPLDLFGCGLGLGGRGFRGSLRLGPARVKQPSLYSPDLLGQLAVAFGRPRLAP